MDLSPSPLISGTTIDAMAVPPLVMAGICAFVAFYHGWVAVRRVNPSVNFAFSATCLGVALYDVFCAGLYNSQALEQGVFWQKLQIEASMVMFAAFSWFIYHLTQMKIRKTMTALSAFLAVLFVFAIVDHGALTVSIDRPAIKTIELGKLGSLIYYEAEPGAVFQIALFVQMVVLLLLLIKTYRFARQKNYHGSGFLFFSICFFIGAAFNDTLVAANVYASVYLMEYFYLIIIVHMTYMLLNQFVRSHENFEHLNTQLENRVLERTLDLEKALDRVRQLAEKAESSSIAKSAFLANMSHEIRTPMNGLIGFTDLLSETVLSEDQKDYVRTIKQSGDSLLSLLNDILDFSKIEAGELALENIEFDIESLCYDVCDLMRPRIGSKPVTLICDVSDAVPERLMGDPNRLRQVLTNLMGNASKFTEQGEIELRIFPEEERDNGMMIHGVVRDTGTGIPADKLAVIFEPFQQADNSDTRRFGGTGLGLSICRQIVSLMNGRLWVESRVNHGSSFHFRVLLGKSMTASAPRPSFTVLSGKKVMVVDSHRASLDMISAMLEKEGMAVTGLTLESDVFKTPDADLADLFIACIRSAASPLLGAVKAFRDAEPSHRRMAMIALSSVTELMPSHCENAGFDAFLPWPVRRDKLCRMAARLLSAENVSETPQENQGRTQVERRVIMDDTRSVTILLAEDNPVNQKLAVALLKREGYRVDVAENGAKAVARFLAEPEAYQLIFMDVHMPDMDGLTATRAIREAGHARIPIIAMTAHAMKGFREQCIEAGMNDYISKPIQKEKVYDMITRWVTPVE